MCSVIDVVARARLCIKLSRFCVRVEFGDVYVRTVNLSHNSYVVAKEGRKQELRTMQSGVRPILSGRSAFARESLRFVR